MAKFFSSQSKTIAGAAFVISGATLLSRLMGIVRDRVFAHFYGAGFVMDTYYAAFKIPDLVYNLLIVGALTAAFIPTFTKLYYKNENKETAWRLCQNVLSIVAIVFGSLAALGLVFAPALSNIIAPGFSPEHRPLLITFTRIMLLSPLFLGLSMVMGGVLQSLQQFILYAIAPLFYNIGIILGAVALVPFLGLNGLAWGVVLGAALHGGLQLYGAYHNGFRWHWRLDLNDANTRLIGKLMAPRTLGLAMTQINMVIITILASYLPAGSITIYNWANNLQGVPLGIIAIPFALAVFPILSTAVAEDDGEGFIKNFSNTTRQIIFLILPCVVMLLLMRAQIVRVIYGSGAFNWTDTIATANTLAFFTLGLFAQALIPLFARAFYALSNTATPFVSGVISELVSIIAALLLMKPLGVVGLALASSIGATLNMIILLIALRRVTGTWNENQMLSLVYRTVSAAIVMAIVVQLLKTPLAFIFNQRHALGVTLGILLETMTAGIVGLLTYAAICRLLRVEEMMDLQASLRRRWLKLRSLPEGLDEAVKVE